MKRDSRVISVGDLRKRLGEVVRDVRRGARFMVTCRNHPAFMILPAATLTSSPDAGAEVDSLFGAKALGRSGSGRSAIDHDNVLYS